MVKIGFLISGVYGYRLFKSIHKKCEIHFVCSYPQKGVQVDTLTPIRSICRKEKYVFLERRQIQESYFNNSDFLLVAGWQFLLKDHREKTIVFHDALLPKYRGFSPTVTALIQGEKRLGVTAFKPVDKVDEGDIYLQAAQKISYPIKIHEAQELVGACYEKAGKEILRKIENKSLRGKKQNESRASYSIWRGEDDYGIDWSWPAHRIKRFVDALGWPYGGAKTCYDSKPVILDEIEVSRDLHFVERHPGKIWSLREGIPEIICGAGMVRILKAHYPNGKKVTFEKLRQKLGTLS